MPGAVRARFALLALLGSATLAGGLAIAVAAGAASPSPCAPRVTAIGGRRAIAYCGPATVVIQLGGRTYQFRHGLCDRSSSLGGLALNLGTLVQGARGNAGRSFVSLVIAQRPSESEAFEAFAGSQQLFADSVIAQGGTLLATGTFTSVLGSAFSGSWDCHGVIYSGP
jgi:hypothetical protein